MEAIVIPPFYFGVTKSLNTRMRPDHPFGRPDPTMAYNQWAKMVQIEKYKMGIEPSYLNAERGLENMAFACDPGFWFTGKWGELFVAANFEAEDRSAEVPYFVLFFRNRGTRVLHLPAGAFFEGGDAVPVGNILLVGYGDRRTNKAGAYVLKDMLESEGVTVVPIRRITKEFYHANSVMTYLPNARTPLLLYYPPAFSDDTPDILKSVLSPTIQIIGITEDEAMRHHPDFGGEYLYSYTLNAKEHNGKILMPYCAPTIYDLIRAQGVKVIVPKIGTSEYERSGGSHCCMNNYHHIMV